MSRFFLVLVACVSLQAAEQPFCYLDGADPSGRYVLNGDYVESLEPKHAAIHDDLFFQSENKAEHLHKEARPVVLDEDDRERSQAFFVDRRKEKEKIVIVVPPLKGRQERMAHLAAVYKDYDVLFPPCYFAQRSVVSAFISHWRAGQIDEGFANASSYIVKAYEWAERNGYTQISATGVCFGACLAVEAQRRLQSEGKSFNRLILDSMPASLHGVSENNCQDPTGVQSGGAKTSSSAWKWFASHAPVRGIYNLISYVGLPTLSFVETIKEVECPMLLIHGTTDASVTNKEFNDLYGAISHNKKYAVVTPHEHMRHCKKSPGLYVEATNAFIETEKKVMGTAAGALLPIYQGGV